MSNIETFNLQKERCKLAHINVRAERHGEEEVPALDLKFEFDGPNNLLAKLHADLRAAFYRKDDNRELIEGDHLPALRFPLMKPVIAWELEIPRTLLRIHGDNGAVLLGIGGAKTNNFKVHMKEGGTVSWEFRVQVSKAAPDAIAILSGMLHQVVPVTIECRGEDDDTPDLFEQVEQQTQQPMSEARQKAETMFATPDTDPDFREVGAGLPDDVVDATFVPPADDLDKAPVTDAPASNVAPIGRGRRGGAKKVSNGSNLE